MRGDDTEPATDRTGRRLWAAAGFVVVAVVVVIVVLATRGDPPAPKPSRTTADCAGATLDARPHTARPGDQITVRGRFYVTSCQDTTTMSVPEPIADVPIVLTTSDGHRKTLATAHPTGSLGTFAITVRLPAHAPPGPARIADQGVSAAHARVDVTR
jgi:hypothetical protein